VLHATLVPLGYRGHDDLESPAWPVSLGLTVMTVSLLFRYAPRRRQPGLSWLMVGAGLATVLWWVVSLLLAAYVTQSGDFGRPTVR
jgi:uncharacterized BrkB/YihY/UPF0761 family membrane protein